MFTVRAVSGDALFDRRPSFYNLQTMPEMQELPKTLEASSPAIFIPNFLVFGDEIVKRVYVSERVCLKFVWGFN